MIDIRLIVEDREKVEENLGRRGLQADLSPIVELDRVRKDKIQLTEVMKWFV